MIDLRPACRQMSDLIAGIDDEKLELPTPCAEYSVRDLIEHVDQGAVGFAIMARKADGEEPDIEWGAGWHDRVVGHVQDLGEAWTDSSAWEGSTAAGPGLDLPNDVWGKIALTEMVVHGWDLAVATGQQFDLPEPMLQACHDHVASLLTEPPLPELWSNPIEVGADASSIDRIVAVTGRDPGWASGA
ncbi:TIGR03086 family metal-binding protein [Antrihabitans cavernicola]|uniref:TIGR03086 family protein n=1 Tax=Antrihabitans cavernicola TaxID=2495913 RepID=A0A5A7SC03_9NOCA|nr:TIGR03086 family metal-binding protein [Spelaeibacter cavernicola]KAA0023436.1 TIGR03086 family protein [Spelaeibacter cavernicola]